MGELVGGKVTLRFYYGPLDGVERTGMDRCPTLYHSPSPVHLGLWHCYEPFIYAETDDGGSIWGLAYRGPMHEQPGRIYYHGR